MHAPWAAPLPPPHPPCVCLSRSAVPAAWWPCARSCHQPRWVPSQCRTTAVMAFGVCMQASSRGHWQQPMREDPACFVLTFNSPNCGRHSPARHPGHRTGTARGALMHVVLSSSFVEHKCMLSEPELAAHLLAGECTRTCAGTAHKLTRARAHAQAYGAWK